MADKAARQELPKRGSEPIPATEEKRGLREKNNEKSDLKAAQVELVKLEAPARSQCVYGNARLRGAVRLEVERILWQR